MIDNFRKKISIFFVIVLFTNLSFAPSAFAHAVVEPKEVGVGEVLKFTLDVPSEQNKSTVAVRLVLPFDMRVGVYTKPGWKAEFKKVPGDIPNLASEIVWSDGEIQAQFREQFDFYAGVPYEEATLIWKIYQTYDDGSIVAWELDPSAPQPTDDEGNPDFSEFGPYSETKVINDLKNEPIENPKSDSDMIRNNFILSIVAIIFSTLSLGILLYKKR